MSKNHKTSKKLKLADAAKLAVLTTASTRQGQLDNIDPTADGDSVIFLQGIGAYVRVNDDHMSISTQAYEPAYTLEEASRWPSNEIDSVSQAVAADMTGPGGCSKDDVDDFGITAMSYADALAQERDSLNVDGGDVQGSQDDDLDAFLRQLGVAPRIPA